jgi:hypothetical protein
MKISWLGVAGLLIKSDDFSGDILIDPYVSGSSNDNLRPDEQRSIYNRIVKRKTFHNVKTLIATHNHFDHENEIPYILSNWYTSLPNPQDFMILGNTKTVKRWKTNWKEQVNEWSKGNHQKFTQNMFTIKNIPGSILTTIKSPAASNLVGSGKINIVKNKLIRAPFELSFVRHFHSAICLSKADEDATRAGTYAIYIKDKSFNGSVGVKNNVVRCGSAYLIFAAGLPFYQKQNKEILKGNYENYLLPDEFNQQPFKPQWLITALKYSNDRKRTETFRQTLKLFHCDKASPTATTVKGITPIHWDQHIGVGPRKVGKQGEGKKKSVYSIAELFKKQAKPGMKFCTLPNITFGFEPSWYTANDCLKKTWTAV